MRRPRMTLRQAVADLGRRDQEHSQSTPPKSMSGLPTRTPRGTEALGTLDDLTPAVEAASAADRVGNLVELEMRPSLAELIAASPDLEMPSARETEDVLGRFANQPAPDSVATETATVMGRNGKNEEGAGVSANVLSRFGEFLSQRMPEAIRYEIGHLLDQYTGTGSRDAQNRMVVARKLQRLGTEYGLSGIPKILVAADKERIRDNPETLSEAEQALLAELTTMVEEFSARPERAELVLTHEQRMAFFAYLRVFRLSGKGGVTEERKRLRMWDMITCKWPEYEESRDMPTAKILPELFKKHGLLSTDVSARHEKSNGSSHEQHDNPADLARALRGDKKDVAGNGHTAEATVTGSGNTVVEVGGNGQAASGEPYNVVEEHKKITANQPAGLTDTEVARRLDTMEEKLDGFAILHGTLERVTRQREDLREEMGRLRLELGGLRETLNLVEFEKNGAVDRANGMSSTIEAQGAQISTLTRSAEEAATVAAGAVQRAEAAEWEASERDRIIEKMTVERSELLTTIDDLRGQIARLELDLSNHSTDAGTMIPTAAPTAPTRAASSANSKIANPSESPMTRTRVNIGGQELSVESNSGAVFIVPITVNNNTAVVKND